MEEDTPTTRSVPEEVGRELACSLGQHDWMVDPEDTRFRECIYCGTVEYITKERKQREHNR